MTHLEEAKRLLGEATPEQVADSPTYRYLASSPTERLSDWPADPPAFALSQFPMVMAALTVAVEASKRQATALRHIADYTGEAETRRMAKEALNDA